MILDLAIDSNGTYIAAVNSKGRCYLWELKSSNNEPTILSPKQKFDCHRRQVLRCKFSPDSQ